MTESMMQKTMQHANKQLQDTLMNYFLENYVSAILKKHLGKTTNRSVRELLDQNLSKDYPKYMALLIKFEDKIEEIGLTDTYEKMLTGLILDQKEYCPESADQWKTHTRKRMLSLMLYCHLKLRPERETYTNFFELWKLVYPTNPLPQRVARSKTPSSHKTLSQTHCGSDNSECPNQNSEQTLLKRKHARSALGAGLGGGARDGPKKSRKLDEKVSLSSTELLDQNTLSFKREDPFSTVPQMYMHPWAYNQQPYWAPQQPPQQPPLNPFMYNNQMMILMPTNVFPFMNPVYQPQHQSQMLPPPQPQQLYQNIHQ